MRRIDWASTLVVSSTAFMAALIPGLFVYRIYGHSLHSLAHEVMPSLIG